MTRSKMVLLISAPIAVALMAIFALQGSYFFSDHYSVGKNRQVGDPLEGDWYHANNFGCFEDKKVFRFKNGDIVEITSGQAVDLGGEYGNRGGRVYFTLEDWNRSGGRYFIEDRGNQLVITSVEATTQNGVSTADANELAFTRCEAPTSTGVALSLIYKVFNPDKPIGVRQATDR